MSIPHYGKLTEGIIEELRSIVGDEYATTRPEEVYCYSKDSTLFQFKPEIILRPTETEQVAAILEIANRERIPVTPRGAGTSASGSPLPLMGGILLDMSSMNRILSIDIENQIAIVEAGVICDALNEKVRRHGFFFPPDPASSPACTIGGMVANNASGNRTIKYGPTRNYVLWLEVVLPTGKVIETGSKTLKSVSDYDLTRLLVGSEGSLGVITKIGLKIVPIPESFATAFFIYDSVEALVRAASKIRLARIVPEMLEFMDRRTTAVAFDYAGIKDVPEGNFLLFDCGESKEAVKTILNKGVKLCKEEKPLYIEEATDPAYRERLITARKAALPALARLKPTTVMEDCTVPLNKLPKAARMIEEIPNRLGVEEMGLGNFGHIGDGNMHPTFTFDDRIEEQREAFFKAVSMLYNEIVLPLGGSITAEHGVGLIRAPFIKMEHGPEVEVMRELKRFFDPNLILNPGKGKGGPYPLERD